ncbi:hypothetical protein EON65_41015 [archaeon]|nr:MAG: hypothetical protein EON65_41015 [archaeon]
MNDLIWMISSIKVAPTSGHSSAFKLNTHALRILYDERTPHFHETDMLGLQGKKKNFTLTCIVMVSYAEPYTAFQSMFIYLVKLNI